jgi:outer membrane protein assembly factor BamE (lipoprotein component of BamABCDE complex)
MSRAPVLFAAAALALAGASACTPTNSFQGFQAIDAAPKDVKVGTDTRATVTARLGTPTSTSTFDKNTVFYISQLTSRTGFYNPRVARREVVAIAYDKDSGAVTAVDTFTLQDGRVIAYNKRETPTRGREMTVLEQMLGSLSTIGALPLDQNETPGTHPGQP